MPINRDSFKTAKDPSELILTFLSNNSNNAYTLEEIYEHISILSELGVPTKKSQDTLSDLASWNLVEITVLKNDIYYIFNDDKNQDDIDTYFESHF